MRPLPIPSSNKKNPLRAQAQKKVKNNKNLKKNGFSSTFFYDTRFAKIKNSANKNLSKKESFYQYLFINLCKPSGGFSTNHELGFDPQSYKLFYKSNSEGIDNSHNVEQNPDSTSIVDLKKDTLQICEAQLKLKKLRLSAFLGFNTLPSKMLNNKSNIANKVKLGLANRSHFKNTQAFSAFITYKKSFLCYWLLPFLGFVSSFPTLSKSSLAFPLNNDSNFGLNIINNYNNTETKPLKTEYSVLLYTNDTLFTQRVQKKGSYKTKAEQPFNSLLLKALSLYKNTHPVLTVLTEKNKKIELFLERRTPELMAKSTSFALLNRNLKARSNFKWYWFNLNQLNSAGAKHGLSLRGLFFPNKLFQPAYPCTASLFIDNKKNQLKQHFLNSKQSLAFNALPTSNDVRVAIKNTLSNVKEASNSQTMLASINPLKAFFSSATNNSATKLSLSIVKQTSKIKQATREHKINSLNPYKSIKKAFFLMDLAVSRNMLNSAILSSQWLKESHRASLQLPEGANRTNGQTSEPKGLFSSKKEQFIGQDFESNKKTFGSLNSKQSLEFKASQSNSKELSKIMVSILKNKKAANLALSASAKRDVENKRLNNKNIALGTQNNTVGLLLAKKASSININKGDLLYNCVFGFIPVERTSALNSTPFEALNKIQSTPKVIMSAVDFKPSRNLESTPQFMNPIGQSATLIKPWTALNSKPAGLEFKFYKNISNTSVLKLSQGSIRGGNLDLTSFVYNKQNTQKTKNVPDKSRVSDFAQGNQRLNYNTREALFNITQKQTSATLIGKNSLYFSRTSAYPEGNKQKSLQNYTKYGSYEEAILKSNRTTYLFLSKYLELIKTKIKASFNPYNLRLTYLPEVNINIFNSTISNKFKHYGNKQDKVYYALPVSGIHAYSKSIRGKNLAQIPFKASIFENKQKLSAKFEKIFRPYLSKSKKANSRFAQKKHALVQKSSPQTPYMKYANLLQNLKLRSKLNLGLRSRIGYKKYKSYSTKINAIAPLLSSDLLKVTKKYSISPLMLIKNRLFINKEVEFARHATPYLKKYLFNYGEIGSNFYEYNPSRPNELQRRQKKHHLKIKRRLKKMKVETRRRKKRKIFYPRPTWITFSMYTNALGARFKSNNQDLNLKKGTLRAIQTKQQKAANLGYNSIFFLKKTSSPQLFGFNTSMAKTKGALASDPEGVKPMYSFWLNNKRYQYFNNVEAQIFWDKNSYMQISRTVSRDLKRVLIKSNWLRSYLNPYLEKVKNIYDEIQKSSKKLQIYGNLRSFILYMYGHAPTLFNENDYSTETLNSLALARSSPLYLNAALRSVSELKNYNTSVDNVFTNTKSEISLKKNLNSRNFNYAVPNLKYLKYYPMGNAKNISGSVTKNNKNYINLIEYNRIVYQRIQRVILNIRENLNLNGQLKNRSKKLGKNIRSLIKRDYTKRDPNNPNSPNQNTNNTADKFIKQLVRNFSKMFDYGYEDSLPYIPEGWQSFSRNKLYWALNKSSTLVNSTSINSYPIKLWETYKNREICNSNKTKKILFNIFMKANSAFQPSNSLDGYSHILSRKSNTMNFLSLPSRIPYLQQKNIDSFESLFNASGIEPGLSTEAVQKMHEVLPAEMYTVKSEKKLITIQNKLQLLGLDSNKQHMTKQHISEAEYKNAYFRFLKQQLLKSKTFYSSYAINNSNSSVLEENNLNKFFNIKNGPLGGGFSMSQSHFHFSSFNNYAKMSNNNYYWWSSFNSQEQPFSFFSASSTNLKNNVTEKTIASLYFGFNLFTPVTLSSFLFHFCALVSFISLGGVRTLIKFNYILISASLKLISKIRQLRWIPAAKTYPLDKDLKVSPVIPATQENQFNNTLQIVNNFKNVKLSTFKYLTARSTKTHLRLIQTPKNSENVVLAFKNNPSVMGWTIFRNKNTKFLVSKKPASVRSEFFNILKDPFFIRLLVVKKLLMQKNLPSFSSQSANNNKTLFIALRSFLKLSVFINKFAYKTAFSTYLLALKSVDILAIPASFIYKFFEKPGEYVVENLAYSFLVEWSSDLISTIPDTVGGQNPTYSYFSKLNKSFTSLMFTNMGLTQQSLLFNNLNTFNFLDPFGTRISQGLPSGLLVGLTTSGLIRRFFNSTFLVFIQQLCEPDIDQINRQKKGMIFWDIWGEYLKKVAEENSINIYELTTDKEEQIKLLSKYEEALLTSDQAYTLSLSNRVRPNIGGLNLNNYLYSKHSPYNLNLSGTKSAQSLQNFNKNFNTYAKKIFLNKFNFATNSRLNLANQAISDGYGFAMPKNTNNNYYNWSVSQFLSYQGKDTDLFIDLHPPKTFASSAASTKYSYSVQQPIGSIVCQIYSGIFYKQISKNILVVGSAGVSKSLLIQAIAGETELKIITDNAHRYAIVQKGVAVGIKLLRDVFEALSVHTPCIFLMEDIHAIGERRPFLIDEAAPSSTESTYNKNKSMQGLFLVEKSNASREILYKSNKHLLSHYKKPYKEMKGLATNHFDFTFLYGNVSTKIRNTEIRAGGAALPIQVIKKETRAEREEKPTEGWVINNENVYSSSLLIKPSNDQLLSPPASSPFSVLILKEAAKFKHKKVVKELAWFGLPGEQYSLVSKYNYSIRVKVALLADLVLSNLSIKLDMITDLLVIIDSVKGTRGFVVFATTHVPYILDPALRRPGRFDETISLPLIPSLFSRWSNYRYNVQYLTTSLFKKYSIPLNYTFNKGTTLDLFNSSPLSFTQAQPTTRAIDKLINYIYNTLRVNQNQKQINLRKIKNVSKLIKGSTLKPDNVAVNNFKHPEQVVNKILSNSTLEKNTHNYKTKMITAAQSASNNNFSVNSTSKYLLSLRKFKTLNYLGVMSSKSLQSKESNNLDKEKKVSNKQVLQLKSKHYSNACRFLISLILYTSNNDTSLKSGAKLESSELNALKWPSMLKFNLLLGIEDYSVYLSLFGYPFMRDTRILMGLIGSKMGEHFAISANLNRNQRNFEGALCTAYVNNNATLFNYDNTWKYASSLLFSYIQKRQCSILNKNLAFSSTKLLSFNNKYSLMEPSTPPMSNILLPAKRYENYKRSFNNQYISQVNLNKNNFGASVNDKIQLHEQQRLLKRLYKYPIKEFFRSEILNSNTISTFSTFNNSFLVLTPLEKTNLASLNKMSSVNWCYRNILYNRHKTYLTNQWWNAQQGEHNAETTFLSDIDWRYTFVKSIGNEAQIDFPDAEQFYNPRNRRWILTNGDWNHWFNIQAELKDIYSHYIYNSEAMIKAYKYLDQNREVIDFYAEILHQAPLAQNAIGERDILNLYKRFF